MALRVVHKTSRVVVKIIKTLKSVPDKQALATEALSVRTLRRGGRGAVGKEERAKRASAKRPTQHSAVQPGAAKFSEMRAERGARDWSHPTPPPAFISFAEPKARPISSLNLCTTTPGPVKDKKSSTDNSEQPLPRPVHRTRSAPRERVKRVRRGCSFLIW